MFKRLISLSLTLVMAVALSGCFLFEPQKTKKKLTTYLTDSPVVSVRYYSDYYEGSRDEDEPVYHFEELDPDELDGFLDKLDSMELQTLEFKNYWWADHFGIEMELEDGTYLRYDGTQLEHNKAPIDEPHDSENSIRDKFIEVTNCDFWDEMKVYFPSIEANGDKVY
ncbi:hypothetical protein [Butyrivibrio sp. AE2032]|uniref:hypothetical protein n=1 Tax=Butyrivibrio sp. AE2032 TaxID=1458463 RepID=UPI00048B3908|nr:hypothetical protein [Butyrivibrio sp. AE2032]